MAMVHKTMKKKKEKKGRQSSLTILNLSAKTTSSSVKAMASSISDTMDTSLDLREGMSLCFFALLLALFPKNGVRDKRGRVVVFLPA